MKKREISKKERKISKLREVRPWNKREQKIGRIVKQQISGRERKKKRGCRE